MWNIMYIAWHNIVIVVVVVWLNSVGRVFHSSVVSFETSDILPKGRMEMNGNDELVIHAISFIREKLKKRPDKVTITNFVHSRHGLSHTVVADIMAQLEDRGVIFRKVKKRRHSFFISDLDEDENSSLLEERAQDSDVKRKEDEKQREIVCEPRPNGPPLTIMDFVHAELEQTELRLANKIMTKLEGKYVEKANNEKVLIERLEREVDFLKSEIQNKNNQILSMLRSMDNSKANFQNVEEVNKGGACKNNAIPCTNKTYEWKQVIPKRLGMNRPSMAKKLSNEFDWHASYEDFPPLSNTFDLLSSLDLHDTGDYFCTKSSAKSHRPAKVAEESTRATHAGFENASLKTKDHPRVIDHSEQSSTAACQNVTKRLQEGRKPKPTQDCITILGNSMVKNIQGFKMKQANNNDKNVYVKSFSGATVDCMNSYVCPTIKKNPKTIILHCGTNDLKSPQGACNIAQDIIDLAEALETGNNSVMVSGLVPRGDFLNGKATEVNKVLKQLCQSKNLKFIDNSNINPSIHLNRSRLHLNEYGTTLLANNFIFNLGF